jgi:signal transduction histidine kinase
MRERPLEPGLLPIFRLYIAMRLGIILSSGVIYLVWYRSYAHLNIVPYAMLFLLDLAFLFIFLGWPWLQRRLGTVHLPVALIISTVIPIVEAQYLRELYGSESLPDFWLVFPFLLVPLILTAWQYEFQFVIAFVLETWLLELLLLSSPTYLGSADVPTRINLLLIRSFLFLLIGYIVSKLVGAQRRQRGELAEANKKLVRYAVTLEQLTISRERNRLARELHDTLAHTLSGLAVQLEAIGTVWDSAPSRARHMLDRALETTRTGLDETRRALQDLRAVPLEDLGLPLALRSLAGNVAARGGITLEMDVAERIPDLPPEVEQTYYRVAQEALENVIRHASAQWMSVSLGQTGGRLVLEIADDGSGFAEDSVDPEAALGLVGMRERAEMIGGTLEIESRAGRGTTIRLSSEGQQ